MLGPWIRLMTRADVARSKELAERHTEEEIVAMAVKRHRKDALIGLWLLLSCFGSMGIIIALAAIGGPAPGANPFPWIAACFIALFLPFPVARAAAHARQEGRIISLAYFMRKDPTLKDRFRTG
jgi:hypothetical protein